HLTTSPLFPYTTLFRSEMLHAEDFVRRLARHDFDRVLVAEVVGALDSVESVRLPGVVGVEGRVDAALGGVGVGPDRMDLADDSRSEEHTSELQSLTNLV